MRNNKEYSIIPIRMPAYLRSQIKTLSSRSGLSDSDVMRMAISRGLPRLEKFFGEVKSRK